MEAGEGTAEPAAAAPWGPVWTGREEKASKPKGMAGTQQDKLGKLERLSKTNMAKLRMCLVHTSEGEINAI